MNIMLGYDGRFLLSNIDFNKDVMKLIEVEEGSLITDENPLNYSINRDIKGLAEIVPGPSVLDYVKYGRNNIKIPINILTTLIALIGVKCKVIFKHSDMKVKMNGELQETHYFKEYENLSANKTIVKNLDEIKIDDGSIRMEYNINGSEFYYELVKLTKNGPKLNEFYIEISKEDFEKVKDRICYETIDNFYENLRLRLSTYKDGQDLLEFPILMKDYFIPICSSVFEKMIQLNTDLVAKEILNGNVWKDKFNYDKWRNENNDEKVTVGINIGGSQLKVKMPLFNILFLKNIEFQEFQEFISLSSVGLQYSLDDKISERPDEFKKAYASNLKRETQLGQDEIIKSIKNVKLEILKWKLYYFMIVQEYVTALSNGFELWIPVSNNAYLVKCEVIE